MDLQNRSCSEANIATHGQKKRLKNLAADDDDDDDDDAGYETIFQGTEGHVMPPNAGCKSGSNNVGDLANSKVMRRQVKGNSKRTCLIEELFEAEAHRTDGWPSMTTRSSVLSINNDSSNPRDSKGRGVPYGSTGAREARMEHQLTRRPTASTSTDDRPSQMLPLCLALLPYLLGKIFGSSDMWRELSNLLLVIFCLYLSIKWPWDVFDAVMDMEAADARGSPPPETFGQEGRRRPSTRKYLAIALILCAPIMTLFFLDRVHVNAITGKNAELSGAVAQLIHSEMFIVIALFNPIKYFFFQSTNPRKRRIHPGAIDEVSSLKVKQLEDRLSLCEAEHQKLFQFMKQHDQILLNFQQKLQLILEDQGVGNMLTEEWRRRGRRRQGSRSMSLLFMPWMVVRLLLVGCSFPLSYLRRKLSF